MQPELIKAGILMSVIRASEPIHSFKYCLGAIKEAAGAGMSGPKWYLYYAIKKYQQEGKRDPK